MAHNIHSYVHTNTLTHMSDEEVTSGKMSILITMGQLPFQQDYDLCEIMDDYGLSCPVKQGKFSFGLTMNIPGYVPSVSGIML